MWFSSRGAQAFKVEIVTLLRPILKPLLPLLYLDVFHSQTSLLPIAQVKLFPDLLDCISLQSMKWISARFMQAIFSPISLNGFENQKKLLLE